MAKILTQNLRFWGSLGDTAPKVKIVPGAICIIMQNFTPIGVTVAEISVTGQKHTPSDKTQNVVFACCRQTA